MQITQFPKIAIIILNWNGKDHTLECLQSLTQITYPHYEIVVVDNASYDNSIEAIKEKFPHVSLLVNSSNLGYSEGNNIGIKYCMQKECEYILLLNNDTIVAKDLVNRLYNSYLQLPDAGIIGPTSYHYLQKDKIDHLGGMWSWETANFRLIQKTALAPMQKLDYICGCCLFFKKTLLEKIGFFDKRFFLFWEEADLCYRCHKIGLSTYTDKEAKLWHKISASFQGKHHQHYYWWRNRLLWMEKHIHKEQRKKLYKKVLFKEILRIFKLWQLRKLHYFFGFFFSSLKKQQKRKEIILSQKASLQGIRDYFLRKFGQGPKWLTKKHSSQTLNHVIRKIIGRS